jgi:hypothetical protein
MPTQTKTEKKRKNKQKGLLVLIIIALLLIGMPLLFLHYQSKRTGMTWSEVLHRVGQKSEELEKPSTEGTGIGERIDFLSPSQIGNPFTDSPQVSHLQIVDLDRDSLPDILVCDTKDNFVSWIRQYPQGVYQETILANDLIAPAHLQVLDFDQDGDYDILVAVLGMLFPNNDKIGSVVILENEGKFIFTKHTVVEKIARVSDVRGGDLDNDGDMDLAVAQFGYDDGETRWIENLGNWKFRSHILQNLSGPINVEIIDIDKDNDLDIISLVSQEWEEIYGFLNDGTGNFQPKLLNRVSNEDFGSSGILMCDLDKDGDMDILYTNGDAFDYIPPTPRPWHGVNWLENKGNLSFEFHRICDFPGAYNARPVDIDNDNDLDLFVISAFNVWDKPQSQSFVWLENNGSMQFTMHPISSSPTHLLSLETGDLNNDGLTDFVTGGMHVYPPHDRLGRITIWMNNGAVQKVRNNFGTLKD